MATIKARTYGNENSKGRLRTFTIEDELPVAGERVQLSDPGYIWGTPELCRLDPEQGHRDEGDLYQFDFYECPIIDAEDGEISEVTYVAIRCKRLTEPTPLIIKIALDVADHYADEDAYVSNLMLSSMWDADFVEPSEDWLRQTYRAVKRSVADILKETGMTQRQLCERFEIPRRTVEDWARGVRTCPLYTRLMMQELLGMYKRA